MVDVGDAVVIFRCWLLMTQTVSTVKNMTIRGTNPKATLRTRGGWCFTFYKEVMELCKNFVNVFIFAIHCDTVMLRRAPTVSTKTVHV